MQKCKVQSDDYVVTWYTQVQEVPVLASASNGQVEMSILATLTLHLFQL